MRDYYVVQYDRNHNERAYQGQWLKRPGLPHLSPAAIANTPHFFTTQRNADRSAQAHGMSCYSIKSVGARYAEGALKTRRALEDRFVWHYGHHGATQAESFSTLKEGRAKFKRDPDAIGVYSRDEDGALRFLHESRYNR